MRAVRIVALAPTFHDDPRLLQRVEEFAVEQFVSQFYSVILNLRQASAIPRPLPISISIVRRCPLISSALYRFRAMTRPSVGWNPNSRLDLVNRGQVNPISHSSSLVYIFHIFSEPIEPFREGGMDLAIDLKVLIILLLARLIDE